MLGAIIGDLAASTYENNKEWFYHCLISPFVESSEYGTYYLQQLDILFHAKGHVLPMPFLSDQEHVDHDPRWHSCMVMLSAIEAWLIEDDGKKELIDWHSLPIEGKPDVYGLRALRSAVFALRHGDTKYRISQKAHDANLISWETNLDKFPVFSLDLLQFSWACFRDSFDFTSAIHNAARRSPSKYRHVVCMFTGLLAEAMYGARGIMIKQKYASLGSNLDPWGDWGYPAYFKLTPLEYHDLIFEVQKYQDDNLVFMPKNYVCLDVEYHIWTPFTIKWCKDFRLSKEARRRLMKGYCPSEDHKYALYYDDGWYYAYRGTLLGRFQVRKKSGTNTYFISRVESADDKVGAIDAAIEEILCFVLTDWDYYSIEPLRAKLMHLFKFYKGDSNCPFASGDERGKWWLWESMVYEEVINGGFPSIHEWWKMDKELYMTWSEKYKGFCWDEKHMLNYFANMHMKWLPYDNVDEAIEKYINF